MKNGNIFSSFISFSLLFLSLFFPSCQSGSLNFSENQEKLALTDFNATLPYGKGVNLVEGNCGICHSTQYINMQPNLSKENWEKIVDKMIHNFGLPIADSASRNAIVAYLVDIRGKN